MPRSRRRSSTATATCSRPSIHRARIDRLLYPDDPTATEAALRVSKLLPADEQKKIAARIAVVKRGGNAGKLLDALPASAVEADVGLRFNRIQWLRRTKDKDRRQQAWKMLLDAPSEPNVLLDLNNWWTERRINCRGALNDGQPRTPMRSPPSMASSPATPISRPSSSPAGSRCASWASHIRPCAISPRCARAATSSKSIALGEYWLGRTVARARRPRLGHGAFPWRGQVPAIFLRPARPPIARRTASASRGDEHAATEGSRHSELPLPRRRARDRCCAQLGARRRHPAIPARAVAQAHQSGGGRSARRAGQGRRRTAGRAAGWPRSPSTAIFRSATMRCPSGSFPNSEAC